MAHSGGQLQFTESGSGERAQMWVPVEDSD